MFILLMTVMVSSQAFALSAKEQNREDRLIEAEFDDSEEYSEVALDPSQLAIYLAKKSRAYREVETFAERRNLQIYVTQSETKGRDRALVQRCTGGSATGVMVDVALHTDSSYEFIRILGSAGGIADFKVCGGYIATCPVGYDRGYDKCIPKP
ncbi:MAG TPA: hypothetical protein PKC28_15720 [Bdellovibrionales bacterium]|mgnify:CR=1 FL=1|nr:hypothetical protein [Bdellovibrionales bacterium]